MSKAALITILFAGTFGLAALRVPIAFSMGLASAVVLFLMQIPLSVVYVKMTATVDSWPFLAIPFFLLARNVMTVGVSRPASWIWPTSSWDGSRVA